MRALLASLLLLLACKSPPPTRAPEPAVSSVSPVSPILAPPENKPDLDGDGFLDVEDRCPDDPGIAPDGCPIPDTDGDGLLDPDDRCVTEPEQVNGHADSDGCPDGIPPDLAAMTGVIAGLLFELDKDIIKISSRSVLDQAVQVLHKYPEVRIEVSVHTDSAGSPEYGRNLPKRRADAIKRYLVDHGVADARIEARGAGPDEPIDTNKTAKGRAKNRRVEFTILVP